MGAISRFVLRVVQVVVVLLLVVIPVPVTFNWMKRLSRERRNDPAQLLEKD